MSKFKVGDKVETVDDVIVGIVQGIQENQISVETEEGFMLSFSPGELMLVANTDDITVHNFEVARIKKEKEIPKRRNTQTVKPKERSAPKMEVDLHIHHLVPSNKGMSNYEILNIQLDAAKRQLEFAMAKRIQKVVFIHGVGEGILKEELYYLFKRYENVKYYDADYQKYGLGATEVYIYQNA
ncbi:DNA mismatch repair protein MutS [Sediminicola sp. YIK13]|uniref:Smr/MutS family protein n=1 Tax=Sediminicola sp. YIK13 TaxID=1453352 RepID=UPI000720BDF4|nr:Smr/MutS family protein [Sediminicola sp. YIK13]ALM07541.1 DNA mismatch repair protein MutS [Sediminicola sp. YIK13]